MCEFHESTCNGFGDIWWTDNPIYFSSIDEDSMKADAIALQLRNKEQGEFWRKVNALNNKKAPLANTVNGCTGSSDMEIRGADLIHAEHLIHASDRLTVLLSISTSIMKHTIVKTKTGDVTYKNNYRPIAVATSMSKVMELLILSKSECFLNTSDNQFGFKKKHGTDMCIHAFRQTIEYYKQNSSPVFICYLDATKAFDRVNHWLLFKKLLDRNMPLHIVRLLVCWYRTQRFNVQWGARLRVFRRPMVSVKVVFFRLGYLTYILMTWVSRFPTPMPAVHLAGCLLIIFLC